MKITFDWKYSLHQMPKKDEKIYAYYDNCGHFPDPKYNRIVIGKFCGEDDLYEYGKGNFVLTLIGRELSLKSSIVFGSCLSYQLSLDGFFWDYVKPNHNIPDIKFLRKLKLDKIKNT